MKTTTSRLSSLGLCILLQSTILVCASCAQDVEVEVKLIDRFPFDRVTLNAANENAELDVQLLDFPNRRVPNPLPTTGSLELRRLSDPATLYQVAWSDIARVDLYEQLVLQEASQFVSTGDLDRAFENLAFLHANYPELPGLEDATESYLQQDAVTAFRNNEHEEALAILSSLYDLNPQRAGLARAVEGISNRLITSLIEAKDFTAARRFLENLHDMFPELPLTNQSQWEEKFREDAAAQVRLARQAMERQEFTAARKAARAALGIVPDYKEAQQLFAEIDRLSPQTIVGVGNLATPDRRTATLKWDSQRVARLVSPNFVELTGIGSEGGDYHSPWAELEGDDAGLHLNITLNERAIDAGITPEGLVLTMLDLANPQSDQYRPELAALMQQVEILDGRVVAVTWQHPFVKPLGLLRFSVAHLLRPEHAAEVYDYSQEKEAPDQTRLEQLGAETVGPKVILEQTFDDEETALLALEQGEIDVLADVPPWHYERLAQVPFATVSTYRIPTVHILQLNYDNPLAGRREFRRALCYGINRSRIVSDVLGGAAGRPGFKVLSGPIPAGINVGDTLGYAYRQDLQPLPYEPRLAAVLHTAARNALVKIAALEKQAPEQEDSSSQETSLPDPEPLLLEHGHDPVDRAAAQLIKQQLDVIGVPVKLRDWGAAGTSGGDWDLRLVELGIAEPVVELQQLLGPRGLAGRCSPSMHLALRRLESSTNWNDARSRLHEIHQIAADDLPVVPLWQTVNYFAHSKSLKNVGQAPVSLYQNVSAWEQQYAQPGN